MSKAMIVDTYWMEKLCDDWNNLAKALEKETEIPWSERTRDEVLLKAKLWREAAKELKERVETYSMPLGSL